MYHITHIDNIESIFNNGLIPQVGERSVRLNEEKAVFLFPTFQDYYEATWLEDEFEDEDVLVLLEITIDESVTLSSDGCAGYEIKSLSNISPHLIALYDLDCEAECIDESIKNLEELELNVSDLKKRNSKTV